MTANRNPQARQMGDESMARNLAHQADAIWPQEEPLFDRYGLPSDIRILDLGCGTGEITRRLARSLSRARPCSESTSWTQNLALARQNSAFLGERVRYEKGDAFALALPDAAFDLVTCRHMSQAVPHFEKVLAEITRVLKPGGFLHLSVGRLRDAPYPERPIRFRSVLE